MLKSRSATEFVLNSPSISANVIRENTGRLEWVPLIASASKTRFSQWVNAVPSPPWSSSSAPSSCAQLKCFCTSATTRGVTIMSTCFLIVPPRTSQSFRTIRRIVLLLHWCIWSLKAMNGDENYSYNCGVYKLVSMSVRCESIIWRGRINILIKTCSREGSYSGSNNMIDTFRKKMYINDNWNCCGRRQS